MNDQVAAVAPPGTPIIIHTASNGGSAVKVAVIGAFALIFVGALSVFGDRMFGDMAKIQASVEEVHEQTNSNLAALREELAELRKELADTIERNAELRETLGGMVPAPPVPAQ